MKSATRSPGVMCRVIPWMRATPGEVDSSAESMGSEAPAFEEAISSFGCLDASNCASLGFWDIAASLCIVDTLSAEGV